MAQVKKTPIRTTAKKSFVSPFSIYWTKENYYLLALGAVLLIAGFYVMSLGTWDNPVALTLSPILLIAGYLLVFPSSILYKKKAEAKQEETENVPRQS
ncbi:MAG: hypothetical protein ACM3Q2_16820 [Syntrophothermus sp.]